MLVTHLGEAREAWLEARLGALGPPPRLDVTRVTADFRHAAARRGAVVNVRCAPDGVSRTTVRTRETITNDAGDVVVHAGATAVLIGDDGQPRPLAAAERNALLT